jgi:hypothetical protein
VRRRLHDPNNIQKSLIIKIQKVEKTLKLDDKVSLLGDASPPNLFGKAPQYWTIKESSIIYLTKIQLFTDHSE